MGAELLLLLLLLLVVELGSHVWGQTELRRLLRVLGHVAAVIVDERATAGGSGGDGGRRLGLVRHQRHVTGGKDVFGEARLGLVRVRQHGPVGLVLHVLSVGVRPWLSIARVVDKHSPRRRGAWGAGGLLERAAEGGGGRG
jgi:hypothetical protein